MLSLVRSMSLEKFCPFIVNLYHVQITTKRNCHSLGGNCFRDIHMLCEPVPLQSQGMILMILQRWLAK